MFDSNPKPEYEKPRRISWPKLKRTQAANQRSVTIWYSNSNSKLSPTNAFMFQNNWLCAWPGQTNIGTRFAWKLSARLRSHPESVCLPKPKSIVARCRISTWILLSSGDSKRIGKNKCFMSRPWSLHCIHENQYIDVMCALAACCVSEQMTNVAFTYILSRCSGPWPEIDWISIQTCQPW